MNIQLCYYSNVSNTLLIFSYFFLGGGDTSKYCRYRFQKFSLGWYQNTSFNNLNSNMLYWVIFYNQHACTTVDIICQINTNVFENVFDSKKELFPL